MIIQSKKTITPREAKEIPKEIPKDLTLISEANGKTLFQSKSTGKIYAVESFCGSAVLSEI